MLYHFKKIKTNELLQKLTASQLVQKLIYYGTQTFSTVFVRTHH